MLTIRRDPRLSIRLNDDDPWPKTFNHPQPHLFKRRFPARKGAAPLRQKEAHLPEDSDSHVGLVNKTVVAASTLG